MKFECTQVFGFENAILGMRLPMSKNVEDAKTKIDSRYDSFSGNYIIGTNDLKVAINLHKADGCEGKHGEPNSKFLRMIHVQVAITAPLSFWKEWDTYKVSTVANSTSTMHRIQKYEINEECFEPKPNGKISSLIDIEKLEDARKRYNETGDKDIWYDIIYGLGDSWLQTRMCDINYATLSNMVCWRKNHKQNCWSGKDNPDMENFMKWVSNLPYAKEFILPLEEDQSIKNKNE